MLNVTEAAQAEIKNYFTDKEIKPIRVFLTSGCGGEQLAMALDDARPDDEIFQVAGIQYLVEKAFLAKAQWISIDFAGHGFKVDSALELTGGCGGCGSSSSCCG